MDIDRLTGPGAQYPLAHLDRELAGIQNQIQQSQNAVGPARLDQLKNATQEFEALLLGYMLKVMRSTVEPADSESSSMGKDIYLDMFDSEIASNISKTHSLGIGRLLYEQLAQIKGTPASTGDPEKADPVSKQSTPVSSDYGLRRDPFNRTLGFHSGVDIAAPAGTPFRAFKAGTVVHAGLLGSYGNTVVVEHPDGDRTLYAHASSILVRTGDLLTPEQVIGTVGTSGRSTGPHLHLELRRNGHNINPGELLTAVTP